MTPSEHTVWCMIDLHMLIRFTDLQVAKATFLQAFIMALNLVWLVWFEPLLPFQLGSGPGADESRSQLPLKSIAETRDLQPVQIIGWETVVTLYFYSNILCRDEYTSQNLNEKLKSKLQPVFTGIRFSTSAWISAQEEWQNPGFCLRFFKYEAFWNNILGGSYCLRSILSISLILQYYEIIFVSALNTKWVNLNIHPACSEMSSSVYTVEL